MKLFSWSAAPLAIITFLHASTLHSFHISKALMRYNHTTHIYNIYNKLSNNFSYKLYHKLYNKNPNSPAKIISAENSYNPSITCALIKPEISNDQSLLILQEIKSRGYRIRAIKKHHLSKNEAQRFYAAHKNRPFFEELISYMTSKPITVIVLEHLNQDAIAKWRSDIGDTDPQKANPGTIRARYGFNKQNNGVHGSDSLESMHYEIACLAPEAHQLAVKLLRI